MTANEKSAIYTLLKTAADSKLGYFSPDFPKEDPVFSDDIDAINATEKPLAQETSQQDKIQSQEPAAPQTTTSLEESSPSQSQLTTIAAIAQKVAVCQRCQLSQTRHNTVPGVGPLKPVVMVIGEGPGHDEDMSGEPFVGPAGQLLDKELAAIHLSRHTNTFIANIVKCRPPNNRTPFPEEAAACSSFLEAQIFALKPKMILCAGSTAAKNLLKTEAGVGRLRGNFYDWNGIPVLVTYHPSALLRDSSLKRPAWEDLKLFASKLQILAPDYANQSK